MPALTIVLVATHAFVPTDMLATTSRNLVFIHMHVRVCVCVSLFEVSRYRPKIIAPYSIHM